MSEALASKGGCEKLKQPIWIIRVHLDVRKESSCGSSFNDSTALHTWISNHPHDDAAV